MGWLDWEGGFHHGHDDFDPDDLDFDREESEAREQKRKEREAADAIENITRRYPPNCGFCGEPFVGEEKDTYGDYEDGYYTETYGHYACGTDIETSTHSFSHHPPQRELTFEERAYTKERTGGHWSTRVPQWRLGDYKGDPTASGQTPACRRIMELRWKTDPEALERDRTDTRTERERMSVEAERELVKQERADLRIERLRAAVARMTTTDTWTDAQQITKPLAQLGHGHLLNIQLWLDTNAAYYQRLARELYWHDRDRTAEDVHGEPVDIGIPSEVHNRMENDLFREPLEWMRDQPVYHAVRAAILASAPVDRRQTDFVSVVSDTPPPVPEAH